MPGWRIITGIVPTRPFPPTTSLCRTSSARSSCSTGRKFSRTSSRLSVTPVRRHLLLDNIRCPACLWLNERHLRSLPGVIDVHIDDTTQRARVRWDPQTIRLSEILRAITDIGYIAHPYDATRSEQLNRLRRRRSTERLIFAGAVGMLVMNFSLATYVMGDTGPGRGVAPVDRRGPLDQPAAGAAAAGLSRPGVFRRCLERSAASSPGNGCSRGPGSLSRVPWQPACDGHAGGARCILTPSPCSFSFLLLARRWELRGKLTAADRLDRLARITPRTASRLDSGRQRDEVPVDELVAGDRIRLLPGETLPVDGIWLTASAASMNRC